MYIYIKDEAGNIQELEESFIEDPEEEVQNNIEEEKRIEFKLTEELGKNQKMNTVGSQANRKSRKNRKKKKPALIRWNQE
jgi:hypothetical protein